MVLQRYADSLGADARAARQVLRRLIELDYEYIAVIDARGDAIRLLGQSGEELYAFSDSGSYSEQSREIIASMVAEEQVEECIGQLSLESIVAGLDRDGTYSRTYVTRAAGGGVACKRWKYAWIDESRTTILCTRIDVTDIYETERRQKELLRHALARAEQASAAKTEFLSHISHEIRTPMNTIIGMTALAAQAVNDPVQVADSLAKVGISARFLLSLINDILDMSRIESGRVHLKREKIPFEEFINGVNAICYAQAAAKGVDYDAVMTSFTEDYYLGDAMKLQQVLINIIANAVKFTPAGGKVQLMAHQEKLSRDTALMKFTINDTGVGIREAFLPRIFEPFEQDQTGSSPAHGGTGLGLAISKSLVDLMGGTIAVNSIVGIGTEFTVSVRLGIAEESRPWRKTAIPFEKISALVVDDEIIVCRHTERILADMGIRAAWATSGHEALHIVQSRKDNGEYYDIILIDWKMPGMDGIETARRIRALVGPDVTIIIITAYDWGTIEAEARQAGVNMLISKPLFRASLSSTFEKIYAEKERRTPPPPRTDYDFSGRRALLVDDHMLNAEIARHLLTGRNMDIDVAENGLVALERFAEKPDGYYDVVLMDIRMPVMDGLSATRSIRQMTKPYARTVPIIAMSANAFDEDVDKSRAAGMNAHLAKPIEPSLLYQTIEDYLERGADAPEQPGPGGVDHGHNF